MRIGIIGTGNVGSAVGTRWALAGHDVMFGARDAKSPKVQALVAAAGKSARAGTVAEAAAFGPVVVLATPFEATESAIRQAGDLGGKVVIDCTNPLRPDLAALSVGHTTSGAESVARWAKGARRSTRRAPATMFVCGDDAGAKATVSELVKALGFDVVDAGPLAQARLLEPLALLWIWLAYQGRLGPSIAFRLMRRS